MAKKARPNDAPVYTTSNADIDKPISAAKAMKALRAVETDIELIRAESQNTNASGDSTISQRSGET